MKKFMFPKSAKGQSLVELAISILFLIYLLSGAVEFGIIFFQYVQLRDAAQEGALYGSTDPAADDKIEARARGASATPIDLSDDTKVTVSISINGYAAGTAEYNARACEGNEIVVVVSYTHNIFMPFMPQLLGRGSIPLSGTVSDTILAPYSETCTSP